MAQTANAAGKRAGTQEEERSRYVIKHTLHGSLLPLSSGQNSGKQVALCLLHTHTYIYK